MREGKETLGQSKPRLGQHRQLPQSEQQTQASSPAGPNSLATVIVNTSPSAGDYATTLRRAANSGPFLLQLQRQYGNSYVQRVIELSRQGEEAEATPEIEAAIARNRGGGQPLDQGVRVQMESAFGTNFSNVRIHSNPESDSLNRALSARAFTTGQDIFFRQGEYNPTSSNGQELVAHELTHVVQQGGGVQPKLEIGQPNDPYEQQADQVAQVVMQQIQRSSDGLPNGSPGHRFGIKTSPDANPLSIQRDLSAYNQAVTDVIPSGGMFDASSTLVTTTAEAAGIRAALATLIAADKVKEVKSTDGKKSWFAANHHKNAQLAEIEQAFQAAGYAQAGKMARSLYDIHGEYRYSNEEITVVAPFVNTTSSTGPRVTTIHERALTEYEIRQARRVFKDALNYTKVTIADGSLTAQAMSAGGYARTVGNTVYFPTGASRSMALMIHELTHVWQYQKTGWTYAPAALWAQIAEGYSYAPSGKTPEQALQEARQAGKTLYSYNNEQQGDILADYFRRLQDGRDVTAFQSFIDDIR